MSAKVDPPTAATLKARRVWKDGLADLYREAQRNGGASSWLKDAGGRRTKATKAPDQIGRTVLEMHTLGYAEDAIQARVGALVRGMVTAALPDRPAA